MTIEIRNILAADRTAWAAMWAEYLAFYESELDEAIFDTTFARLLNPDHKTQNAFIATIDGRPVGLVHYLYHAHNWRVEDVCYLQDLFVSDATRGTGIGRKLIEAVYAAADANGTPSVYWMTQEFNENARLLYDRIATLTPFIKYSR